MKEYQVVGRFNEQKLTDVLNSMAREGWRPIGFTVKTQISAMRQSATRQSYAVLLEREVSDE